jgi:hypothetical protein
MGAVHAVEDPAVRVGTGPAGQLGTGPAGQLGTGPAGQLGTGPAARIGAVVASLALAAGIVALTAAPARAVDVFVEVNPSTIQAGFQVGIRGSCGDNLNPATVKSDAFGQVTLLPQYGFLTAAVAIPPDKRARGYTVKLTCPNGSTASTTLFVISMDQPTRGPNTGGGGTADGGTGGTLMITGGLTAVGVGAGLGLLALRRRRADQPA